MKTNNIVELHGYDDIDHIRKEFQDDCLELNNATHIFACYETGYYDGTTYILFQKDDKWYEVSGGHCSCYGLEGQWEPVETKLEAVKSYAYTDELSEFVKKVQNG